MTATARYGFPQIDISTDDVDVTVDFNTPYATIDKYLGTETCLSSGRPGSPIQGQLIFETDTLVVRVWSGTAWTDAGIATCLSSAFPVNPIAGDVVYTTDKKALAAYNGTAWYFTTTVVCTSTTRPTVAIVSGVAVWETDTLAYAEYSGSAWRYTSELTCTSSTRPTGSNTALVAGNTAYETDTTRQILWNGSAWTQVNTVICTSSTHPASPITGGSIFETDTLNVYIYTGSAYVLVNTGVTPFARNTANQTTTSTTPVSSTALTVPVVANGVYTMEAWLVLGSTTNVASNSVKCTWTTTATGATMNWGDSNTTGDYAAALATVLSGDISTDGNMHNLWLHGLLTVSTTAGNMVFQFGTTSASATVVLYPGSWIRFTRVA